VLAGGAGQYCQQSLPVDDLAVFPHSRSAAL